MKENLVTSLAWFFYYCIGAINYSPGVQQIYRYIHHSISAFIVLFSTIGTIGYILTAKSPDILNVEYGITVMYSAIYVSTFPPLSTYLYRKELATIIRYIESYTSHKFNYMRNFKKNHQQNQWKPKYNTVNIIRCYGIVLFLTLPLTIFPPIFGTIFFHDHQHAYRESQFHIILLPFMNDLSSYKIYLLIYIIEGSVLCIIIICGMFQLAFLLIITYELSNIIHYQCHQIRNLSYIINDEFSDEISFPINNDEVNVSIEKLNTTHCYTEVEKLINNSFIGMVQSHQKFSRVTKPFCSYVELFGSIQLISVAIVIISVIFISLNSNAAFEVKGKCIAVLPFVCFYFYIFCELGTLFTEMNEELLLELYSLPWWCIFSAKFQVLVHIWRGQLLSMPKIRAFNTFTLERQFFPSILKYAYSIANILRNST